MRVYCSCGKQLEVPADLAGKCVRCPGCGQPVAAPSPEEAAARQALQEVASVEDAEEASRPRSRRRRQRRAFLKPSFLGPAAAVFVIVLALVVFLLVGSGRRSSPESGKASTGGDEAVAVSPTPAQSQEPPTGVEVPRRPEAPSRAPVSPEPGEAGTEVPEHSQTGREKPGLPVKNEPDAAAQPAPEKAVVVPPKKPKPPVAVKAPFDPQKDLVAHWDFDEGSGNVLHDRSGHGNHGKIRGPKWVKYGEGYALRFDGRDDRVDCGQRPSLDLRGSVSLLAWVNAKDFRPSGELGIIGKGIQSYCITQHSDPTVPKEHSQIWAYISGGRNGIPAPLPIGAWHHIASTYDGTALRLYVDGKEVAAHQLRVKINAGGHFWIGARPRYKGEKRRRFFRGKISEVRVYQRALPPEEIAQHARSPEGGATEPK